MGPNGEGQRRRRPRPEIKCCQWSRGGGTSAVPGRAGGANCCGAERWAGGGRAAQGLPRDSGRSLAAAGVGRAGRAAGSRRRGFEAGPRTGRPRHPGGAARRRVCPAAKRRREPAGALETLWQPRPESPGSCPFLGHPPGRPRRRVTVLGPRQKEPPGDPRRGPASRGSQPRGLGPGRKGLSGDAGPGAEGAAARRSGAGPPRRGAGQRLLWRQTPGPSGAGASATAPRGAWPRSGLQESLPPRGRPGTGR